MKRYHSRNNYDYRAHPGHVFEEESMAIPDQTYSVKDLVVRFQNGTMPPVLKPGGFFEQPIDEEPLPDFSALDLTEIEEYGERINSKLNKLKERYNESIQNCSGGAYSGNFRGTSVPEQEAGKQMKRDDDDKTTTTRNKTE